MDPALLSNLPGPTESSIEHLDWSSSCWGGTLPVATRPGWIDRLSNAPVDLNQHTSGYDNKYVALGSKALIGLVGLGETPGLLARRERIEDGMA